MKAYLVAAVETYASPSYFSNVNSQVDYEQWMRVLAFERAVRNGDSYNLLAGHNMYAYQDLEGSGLKWNLMMVDFDSVFTDHPAIPSDPLAQTCCGDSLMGPMFLHPPFRRAAWRCLYDMANSTDGAMLTNIVNPMIDANAAALAANGYTNTVATEADRTWIANQQTNLWMRLAEVRPGFTNTLLVATNANALNSTIVLSGLAPVEVRSIKLNGNMVPVMWTTVTNWSITTNTATGSNFFQVIGYDRKTNALPVRDVGTYTNQVIINR